MNAGRSIPLGMLEAEVCAGGSQWFGNGGEETGTMPVGKPFTEQALNASHSTEAEVANKRDLLLMEHLPTVRYIARRIHERLPQHVDLDDLVSAGVVGLMDAFSKFDHGKKVQFKSYAQFRIRGAILDSLRTLDWSPRELRRKGRAVEEAIRTVTQRLRGAPSEQEIA
jgi:RNA polymerase sigma factor FliA